jgi:hypothetical protein
MRTVLAVSFVFTATAGCLLKSHLPITQSRGCPDNIKFVQSGNMPCIVDRDGHGVGETFSFTCPPFEVDRFLFVDGADPFAMETQMCVAAAYAGKLDPTVGGPIKLQVLEARTYYPAGEKQHGIKSQKVNSTTAILGFTFID